MPHISNDEIHLWRLDLRALVPRYEALRALLSPAENERAAQFRFAADTRNFVLSHGARREILALYTESPAVQLNFARNAFGTPFLCEHRVLDIRFSAARRGENALLAIARGQEICVDLEMLDQNLNAESLLETVCSAAEKREFPALTHAEKASRFLQLWARKEAVLKALGRGFARDARAIEIGFTGNCGSAEAVFEDEKCGFHWRDLFLGDEIVAAVAIENADAPIEIWDWPPEFLNK